MWLSTYRSFYTQPSSVCIIVLLILHVCLHVVYIIFYCVYINCSIQALHSYIPYRLYIFDLPLNFYCPHDFSYCFLSIICYTNRISLACLPNIHNVSLHLHLVHIFSLLYTSCCTLPISLIILL